MVKSIEALSEKVLVVFVETLTTKGLCMAANGFGAELPVQGFEGADSGDEGGDGLVGKE